MKTNQTKLITLLLLLLVIVSACKFENIINIGEKGNGKVVSEVRQIDSFNKLKVSTAINAIVTFSDNELLTVETDENLMDLLITKVEGNVLKISFSKNIHSAKKRTVYINAKKLTNIKATSAAHVQVENLLDSDHITLTSNSAGSINAEVNAAAVNCETSSAGSIHISGKTANFTGTASSAGNINAQDLKAKDANVRASSGGSIETYVTEDLTVKASSGGNVTFFGNPEKVAKNTSSGGSVSSND